MRIGLNLVFLTPGEQGGMEVYARELLPRLAAYPDLRLTAFVGRGAAGIDWGPGIDEVIVPVTASDRRQWVIGEQLHLPRLARAARCDLVHSLASTGPLHGRFRRVTTIHDLNYKLVPDAHFGLLGLGMRALVPAAAHRSRRIIVDAASTRDDLVTHLRANPDRIDVVPLGVTVPAPAERRPEPMVLCVGAKRPHKNVGAVIDALAGTGLRLVVTGYRSPYEAELRRHAAQRGVALELPEWVESLDDLYARAGVVVVASLYEGFGLPVLEAMARGVPVVASNRSSLPEVAGDAALLVAPDDPPAIRAAIERALAESERLATAGRAQAARFTWERTAELTVASYRAALA